MYIYIYVYMHRQIGRQIGRYVYTCICAETHTQRHTKSFSWLNGLTFRSRIPATRRMLPKSACPGHELKYGGLSVPTDGGMDASRLTSTVGIMPTPTTVVYTVRIILECTPNPILTIKGPSMGFRDLVRVLSPRSLILPPPFWPP